MKKKIDGLIRLSRFQEYLCFVIVTTLLGVLSTSGTFGWRFCGVLVANWLAVGFAFMFNDLEDAPEDALNPEKVQRNPVSCRDLSPGSAQWASLGVAFLAALTYLLLGFWPFILGTLCLLLGFLYFWRKVRLKTVPFLDMASHCLMLAGFQFLTAYFTFHPSPWNRWFPPFLFILAISLYGELFNELRDLEGDQQAGLTDTALLLGRRATFGLMMVILAAGVVSALYMTWVEHLIPVGVLLLMGALAAVLIFRPLLKIRQRKTHLQLQQSFQKPLEVAAASALMIHFIGTWASNWLGGRFF